MFRRVASIGLIALLASVNAGELMAQEVTVGVKGGLNVADLTIDDPEEPEVDLDTKTGFSGGVFGQFVLGDYLAIQPEALFTQKGAKESDQEGEFKLKLDYIEIPVLLMARIPTQGNFRPLFFLAPVVSFESTCKLQGSSDGVSIDVDCDQAGELTGGEFELETKSIDFGLAFGAGGELDLNQLMLQLDVRYNLGLTDLNDSPGAEEVSVKNRTWSFMAGIGYRVP